MAKLNRSPTPVKRSLSRQLLMGFGLSLISIGFATLSINYHLIKEDLKKQVQSRATTKAQTLEFAIESLLETESTSILQRVVQNYATLPNVLEISIVDPSGVVLAQGPIPAKANTQYTTTHPQFTDSLTDASVTGVGSFIETTLNGKSQLTHILPFSSPVFSQSGQRGVVVITIDFHQIQQEIWSIFLTSTTTMVIGSGCMLIIMANLLRKWVLTPVLNLNDIVAKSQTNTTFTLPDDLPNNELRFLAETFERVFQQRHQADLELRKSEAQARNNAKQLSFALSDLKATQAQLIQTEKMAGLGQIVSGLAHEINNPVSFIKGNLSPVKEYAQALLRLIDLYQKHLPLPPIEIKKEIEAVDLEFLKQDLPKLLMSMENGTKRITHIVLSLRQFSRLDEAEYKAVDIHEGIESALTFLKHRLERSPGSSSNNDQPAVKLVKTYGALPLVECYAGHINQVFMNILENALDALNSPRISTPTIWIQTKYQDNRCFIKISDNGIGIPANHLSQIFNPFFTTKPVGKGKGLGLTVSYQTIKHHHGHFTCTSVEGQGTDVTIDLPMTQMTGTLGRVPSSTNRSSSASKKTQHCSSRA